MDGDVDDEVDDDLQLDEEEDEDEDAVEIGVLDHTWNLGNTAEDDIVMMML